MAQLTEHLSRRFLARYGVPFGAHELVTTACEAAEAAERVGGPVMVKSQVPLGGRGKAGAVLRAETPADAAAAFRAVTSVEMDGLRSAVAIVERWVAVDAEFYLAVVIDPQENGPVLLFSPHGGVDVEGAGELRRVSMRLDGSVNAAAFRRSAYADKTPPRVVERLLGVAQALGRAYRTLDAQLVEVNPIGLLADGSLVALDAHLLIDDNALFRQPELSDLISKMEPRRMEDRVKEESRLDYVRLDGELGLISGGAGLTMAAMDVIAAAGSTAACFLDCSANPTKHGYGTALDLLLADEQVAAILINIFGGLTHVDRVAATLTALLAERPQTKPITFRLMGTNVEQAEQVLRDVGIVNHPSLEQAVATAAATLPRPATMKAIS